MLKWFIADALFELIFGLGILYYYRHELEDMMMELIEEFRNGRL